MAKPNSMFYCSLLGGESFDEFAQLGSLRSNLAANPTLMRVCGFPMKSNQKDNFRVPSKSVFSRFMKLLEQLECEYGAMSALFYRYRDRLMEIYPDFRTSLGFYGKKLHSYSTGRTRADGKPWSHVVK